MPVYTVKQTVNRNRSRYIEMMAASFNKHVAESKYCTFRLSSNHICALLDGTDKPMVYSER